MSGTPVNRVAAGTSTMHASIHSFLLYPSIHSSAQLRAVLCTLNLSRHSRKERFNLPTPVTSVTGLYTASWLLAALAFSLWRNRSPNHHPVALPSVQATAWSGPGNRTGATRAVRPDGRGPGDRRTAALGKGGGRSGVGMEYIQWVWSGYGGNQELLT